MNDTDSEILADYRQRLGAMSASQRLHMMSGMFSSARVLVFAAEGAADPSPADVFERMYRGDFSAAEVALVSSHLRASRAGNESLTELLEEPDEASDQRRQGSNEVMNISPQPREK